MTVVRTRLRRDKSHLLLKAQSDLRYYYTDSERFDSVFVCEVHSFMNIFAGGKLAVPSSEGKGKRPKNPVP